MYRQISCITSVWVLGTFHNDLGWVGGNGTVARALREQIAVVSRAQRTRCSSRMGWGWWVKVPSLVSEYSHKMAAGQPLMATCRDLRGGMQSRCYSAHVMLGQSQNSSRGGAQNSSSSSPIDARLCSTQVLGSRSQLRDISHCSDSSSYREKTQSRESWQFFVVWVEC